MELRVAQGTGVVAETRAGLAEIGRLTPIQINQLNLEENDHV